MPTYISGKLQYLDLNVEGAWDQVRASLRLASEQQSIQIERGVISGPFNVFTEKIQESWSGLPGYEIDIEYPRFESTALPRIATELSTVFLGRAFQTLISNRQKPWDQSPDLFEGRHQSTATNGRWDSYGIVHATDHLLSLTYQVGWYGTGAAHPNAFFETYNFLYFDKTYELELENFFIELATAIKRISAACILELSKEFWRRTGEKPDEDQLRWFREGAGEDYKNFFSFTVSQDHFTFLFPPYQVSSYAMGRWSADVSFYDLMDLLKPDGPHTHALIKKSQ